MKERPILFSAPMVQALLAGRKTQTRRIVKCGSEAEIHFGGSEAEIHFGGGRYYVLDGTKYIHCPYGEPGDRLWVRENFWCDTREPNECVIYSEDEDKFKYRTGNRGVRSRRDKANRMPFCGDEPTAPISQNKFWKQKPSIFMPRWASRITLEVVSVRVEGLHEISNIDAKAEGVEPTHIRPDTTDSCQNGYRHAFAALWCKINGKESWDANPLVWVVKFKKLEVRHADKTEKAETGRAEGLAGTA